MKKLILLLLFTSLMFSKEYTNPNGRPFLVTLKANNVQFEHWRLGMVVPVTNFLTISLTAQTWDEGVNYYGLTKDNFVIGYYLESPYGEPSYKRFMFWEDYNLVKSHTRESFVWGFDVELHLPVYKLWSN